jgi:hypothetical protein
MKSIDDGTEGKRGRERREAKDPWHRIFSAALALKPARLCIQRFLEVSRIVRWYYNDEASLGKLFNRPP